MHALLHHQKKNQVLSAAAAMNSDKKLFSELTEDETLPVRLQKGLFFFSCFIPFYL